MPDFESARYYALNRLENELDPILSYHSLFHTRDDVVPAVRRLASMEGIEGESMLLLLTAAYYHDLGFVEQRVEHEEAGIRIASQVLPGFGYTPDQIEIISGMIRATKIPQSPRNLLEAIMADADLDNLGREDFMDRSQALRDELAATGTVFNDRDWYISQIRFMEVHMYFTESARTLRDTRKRQNLHTVMNMLAATERET